jgi:hypothetical protein
MARANRGPKREKLFVFAALMAGTLALTTGCGALGPATKDVTKSAVRGYYDQVDAIDPALQDRVSRKLLDSPAVRDAAHDLLVAMVNGGVDGLTEAERSGKVDAFIRSTLDVMRKEGDAAMSDFIARFDKQLTPIFKSLIDELVLSTSEALRRAAIRDLPIITSAIVESVMKGFAASAVTISEQMRAETRAFVKDDLSPLVGTVSQEAAKQAIVGVREGLHTQLDLHDPEVRDGMREIGIGLAQGIAQGTPTSPFTTSFAIASFILAALLLVAVGAVVALWSRARTSAKVIALLAERIDGRMKSAATVEDVVSDAASRPSRNGALRVERRSESDLRR